MDVDLLGLRRATLAWAAACLLAGGVGCSPVGWGVNEVKSLIHHHSSHSAAPTTALEAAAAPGAGEMSQTSPRRKQCSATGTRSVRGTRKFCRKRPPWRSVSC